MNQPENRKPKTENRKPKKTMDDPKTRREKKGRDKKSNNVYSAKHVREQERLQEKRNEKKNPIQKN